MLEGGNAGKAGSSLPFQTTDHRPSNTRIERTPMGGRISNALSRLRSPSKSFGSGAPSKLAQAMSEPPPLPTTDRAISQINHPYDPVVECCDRHEGQFPSLRVEDYSIHHHGSTYNTTNITYGTANFVESAPNATFVGPAYEQEAYTQQGIAEMTVLWNDLPRRRDVTELEPNSYLEGSREDDVQHILNWVDDPNSGLVLFIHGPAGIGKSTLARHTTHR